MGPVHFHRLQPIPPAHAPADFPTLPVLGRMGRADEAFTPRSRFLADDVTHAPSGKAATFLALEDAGVARDDEVLVPAYHCPTMLHPVLALGATPVLVPVREDLSVDPVQLEALRSARTRALLLPHFFGYVQPEIERIGRWCREHSIRFVEDCAHAFYGGPDGFLPGSIGDYAIASTRKFFPGSEGGAVVANGKALAASIPPAGILEEIRGLYRILSESARYGALQAGGVRLRVGHPTPSLGPADDAASLEEARPAPASEAELLAAISRRRALRSTSFVVRHSDHARIAGVRRRRFMAWRDALRGLPGVARFRDDLPGSQVPYVYPLRLLRPAVQFPALKYAGVAVWRWDQLAVSNCAVSTRLAVELIQLPCQQSLPDDEFDALIAHFVRVIRRT